MKVYIRKYAQPAQDMRLSALAHDLRTPMCCVQGAAQMALAAQRQGRDVSAHMEQILLAVRTMDKLLAQLCDAQSAGRAAALRGTALHRELLALHEPEAQRKGQTLRLDLRALEEEAFFADYAALMRVLTNLLGNAIKYTPQGGSIALTAQRRQAGGMQFVVSDTGMGMKPEFMQRMFVPFERAGESAHLPGRGLGLAIAKRLVERMGGSIAVQSEWGKGTAFTVYLPQG